jgi:hypothetical protein
VGLQGMAGCGTDGVARRGKGMDGDRVGNETADHVCEKLFIFRSIDPSV